MLSFRSGVALRKLSRFVVPIRRSHFNAEFLGKNAANYAPLTPLSTFERAVSLYPSAAAYVYNDVRRTWGEVGRRVRSFASALVHIGIRRGDVVSIMCPNTPPIFEAHFAVPGAGAVLHTINTRLDAASIAFQLLHAETKVVLVDTEYNQVIQDVKRILTQKNALSGLTFISIRDSVVDAQAAADLCESADQDVEYESFLRSGDVHFPLLPCLDEWDAISLNYTSGTTGDPKGVVYHYRGAYLNAISNAIEWNMERFARFLWVVPMFHCNGWVFPWTLAATVGCSYFVRYVRGDTLIEMIDQHRIGYLAGAPITMITMLGCKDSVKRRFPHPVKMWTAGAPPPPPVMKRFAEEFGVFVQTAYGLTETYGPCTSHLPDLEWTEKRNLSAEELLLLSTIQARSAMVEGCKVIDVETMEEVPADGVTMGEVMMRGNIVMKGYLKNPRATEQSFRGGWFQSGDLAVNHGNGRIELKDRSKDIIISGGENISSIEVENIILMHPAIREIALVAKPDEKWGEVPCAFIVRQANDAAEQLTEKDVIAWARSKMAHYKVPKQVVFLDELPKTPSGLTSKAVLRRTAVSLVGR